MMLHEILTLTLIELDERVELVKRAWPTRW